MSDTHTFLHTLFSGLDGAIELRPVPAVPSLRDFVRIEGGAYDEARVDAYVTATTAQRVNAFFGVATRRKGASAGRAEDCDWLPALFVDCDFKASSEAAALAALAAFPLAPSIVVSSGGGTHGYWLLDEPLGVQGPNTLAYCTDIMRRLAAAIPAADQSVAEPARVLRLPGTYNFKKDYPEPRLVTLDVCEDVRYSLDDIVAHIPATAPPRPWKSGTSSLRPGDASGGPFYLPEVILPGDRHSVMFALLRSQQTRGLSFEAAYAACSIENRNRSEVPLEEWELESFLRRAWSTPNRGAQS